MYSMIASLFYGIWPPAPPIPTPMQTTCHRKFIVYFANKKSTTGFCFVSCYCIVVDDVIKQIGFHGNALHK